jgi:hypothetical protein
VASSIISFTHVTHEIYNIIKANKKGQNACIIPCIAKVNDETKKKAPIPVNRGQGLCGNI